MRSVKLLISLLLLGGCVAETVPPKTKTETKIVTNDCSTKSLPIVTKTYVDFPEKDFNELSQIWSYRLDLIQVSTKNSFRVYLGSEHPNTKNAIGEKYYIGSFSPYPCDGPPSNYSIDVRTCLLDLQQTEDIKPGQLPVILVPQALHEDELLGPISIVRATLNRRERP